MRLGSKGFCFEIDAEIYKIGSILVEGGNSSQIYILVWENRIIPFLMPNPIPVTMKEFARYREDNKGLRSVAAHYFMPVKSILVTDIGKDLLKLPRGRDHNAYYDRHCFMSDDKHSYEFQNDEEYQQALNLIKAGLPVLLYDQYSHYAYEPCLPAEIVFGIGPWNFHDELYRKERDARRNHYGSIYRLLYDIGWRLDRAVEAKEKKEIELAEIKEKAKKFSFFEDTNRGRFAMNENAKKMADLWMKEFKKKVKSLEDFTKFIETHPAPREDISTTVRLGDVMQDPGKPGSFLSASCRI